MALGLTQPLTGMSKGMDKSSMWVGITTETHSCVKVVLESRRLNPLELSRPVQGLRHLYLLPSEYISVI